jgi:hypothetical protein
MFKIIRRKRTAPRVPVPPQEPSPETVKEVEAEYDDGKFEEDAAEKREHFERVINAPPAKVYEVFVPFIWRQNAGVTAVEIIKDSKTPNELEAGMIRRLAGYEEEVILVKKNKVVEYKLLDGMPTSYHKSRILFRPEDNGEKTRVIWVSADMSGHVIAARN